MGSSRRSGTTLVRAAPGWGQRDDRLRRGPAPLPGGAARGRSDDEQSPWYRPSCSGGATREPGRGAGGGAGGERESCARGRRVLSWRRRPLVLRTPIASQTRELERACGPAAAPCSRYPAARSSRRASGSGSTRRRCCVRPGSAARPSRTPTRACGTATSARSGPRPTSSPAIRCCRCTSPRPARSAPTRSSTTWPRARARSGRPTATRRATSR